jgi:phosphoglucosamine mutase
MRNHFGTDGIRGRANEDLTVGMAYRIGQFLARHYTAADHRPVILIGRDTRLSGSMLESALACGITAMGGDADLLGVCTSPALIYLTTQGGYDCGIMITASHNPFHDNGIKIISPQGSKMSADVERRIEDYIYGDNEYPLATGAAIGMVRDRSDRLERYKEHVCGMLPLDLRPYRVVIDCANGGAVTTAKDVLTRLGAQVTAIHDRPDGLNINKDCGSTHPESMAETVKAGHYDAGFAFDGDADRLIACCSDGTIVDGDKVLYCAGGWLKEHGQLRNGRIVTTVMANLALFKLLDQQQIGYEVTPVGDKYVYENMCEHDYVVGGEQSGHIIFKDLETTGDGLVTALMLLKIMSESGRTLNELTDALVDYPQILINVTVADKEAAMNDPELKKACEAVNAELNGDGRILVRPSGTEPLVRVMVEARTPELCRRYAQQVADVVRERNR